MLEQIRKGKPPFPVLSFFKILFKIHILDFDLGQWIGFHKACFVFYELIYHVSAGTN